MDATGQIGPMKDNYAADVRKVARELRLEGRAFVKLADRMTRYDLMLVARDSIPASISGVPKGEGYVFVGRSGDGCYWFDLTSYLAPSYVMEKLSLKYGGDGEVIAEFLTRLGTEFFPRIEVVS